MSYIDIGIIAFIVLGALIGLWRGTGKSLIKLVCFLLAVLTCFFLSDYCLRFLLGVEAIKNLALGDTFSIYSLIKGAFADSGEATGVIKMLYEPLLTRYQAIGGAATWGATEEQFLAVAMSLHLFTVFMTVILYAAARIIASILGYVLKIIFVHGEPNIASRIGGLAIGAVKGAVTVMLALFIVSAIFPFSFSAPVNEQLTKSKTASAICNVEYKFITERLYGNQTLELMMENKFPKSTPEPDPSPDPAPETPGLSVTL